MKTNILIALALTLLATSFAHAGRKNEITYVPALPSDTDGYRFGRNAEEFDNFDKNYNCRKLVLIASARTGILMDAICYPRSLRQKQVVSLARACEKEPKPECYSEEYLKYLDSVQNTEYLNVTKSCSILSDC
jgi:hypothetical protein